MDETEELEIVETAEDEEEKLYFKIILIIVCWLAGFLGIQRFIKKYWKSGLIFLFTGGLLGIGWVVDLIWLILDKDLIFPQ
jgi:hypothetical protein